MSTKKTITLEGRNTIKDVLTTEKKVNWIKIAKESKGNAKIQEIIVLADAQKIDCQFIPAKEINRITNSDNPQNIIAELEIQQFTLEELLESKQDPCILLFNKLDYEHNLGAILRVAWGGGVDAVIVNPHGVHELTPVVTKVSMGGAAHVPLIAESLFPALKKIKSYAIPIVGVESTQGESYTNQNLRGPVALVFGGEDSGLSEPLQKYCDLLIHIPMKSALESLNVSVATGIIIFEKLRQDRQLET